MKINSTPIAVIAIFLFTGLVFFYGCKKEDPLKPNPDMELYQNEHYAGGDGIGGIDTTGAGGGGGTDTTGGGGGTDTTGGGGSSTQYFRADINGTTQNFPAITYETSGNRIDLVGEKVNSFDFIEIQVFNSPSTGDTVYFNGPDNAEYLSQNFISYLSNNGAVIFTRVETRFVEGVFYFDGQSRNDTTQTVSITNGEFLINR
jgi:hypothetical protein